MSSSSHPLSCGAIQIPFLSVLMSYFCLTLHSQHIFFSFLNNVWTAEKLIVTDNEKKNERRMESRTAETFLV